MCEKLTWRWLFCFIVALQTKRTFYKHRDNNMFPTFSYSLGLALTQLPFSLIEALLYSVCVYFITNLSLTAADFFIFALIAWSASNCLAGLYRLVAYVSPTSKLLVFKFRMKKNN